MSHTPGPWKLDEDGWCHQGDEWENQRLIAAAPDLLEACEALLKKAEQLYCSLYYAEPWAHKNNATFNSARAAIKKARGE